jgi:hypothetical protein
MRVQQRVAQQLQQPQISASGPKPKPAAAKAAQTSATRDAFGAQPAAADVTATFKKQFGGLAADPKKFNDTMRSIFGDQYDAKLAESYRQKALKGDYSFLPKVRWVSAETIQGNNGAYVAESGTVLLNRDLQSNPSLAASTFVEEAGHHLDAKLNTADTPGDEGEMFRRVLSGEKLTQAQIAEIRADDDHGTITLDGRQVQVEFWNPFKAVADLASDVGDAVVGAAKSVGNTVVDVGKGVVGATKDLVVGVGEGVGGFFTNIVHGRVGDALESLVDGADKAFLQGPERLVSGLFDGTQDLLDGATGLLGPVGKPIDWLGTQLLSAGRTATDTVFGVTRDGLRLMTEPTVGFFKDMESSLGHLFKGEWSAAAKDFGMAFVNYPKRVLGGGVDMVFRALQGAEDVLMTAIGVEKPTRHLNSDEVAMLKKIYGNAIDYDMVQVKEGGFTDWAGMAAHVVGNTVYMPSKEFGADGKLNADGMDTLMHEMGHVWQNQNGGGDYIHKALLAQISASISGGTRNGAYDWRKAVGEGTPFEKLNPEEQAEVGHDIGMALRNDDKVEANDWSPPLSAAELAFVRDAWNKFKAGEGAP